MDLCRYLKVQSRNGKKYILVIVDDFSRFTRRMFLKSKSEIADVLVIFFKIIQIKLNRLIDGIRSDHVNEYENAKIDVFFSENGISHKFSAPRTAKKMVRWRGRIEVSEYR